MPLYEYRCDNCKDVITLLQKSTDPPPQKCEKCGGYDLTKLISAGGFNLKGSGFYKRGMN